MAKVAAIYVRISQDREGGGLGVARQEQDCRELAERLGFEVFEHVYADNDESATKKKPRPAFVRLLADTRAGKFQAILAWHTDRLYRRPSDLQELISALNVHDVAVHTKQSGSLDLSTATGQAHAEIFASISHMEVNLKSERQKRKELESAEKGLPRTSVRAFGFEADGITWREQEALMIQEATRDVLAGTSVAEIIRRWDATGIKTARSGRSWNHEAVRLVLTRWKNAGLRERNIRDKNTNRILETELYPGVWDALVPREQLEAVRNLLLDPKRRRNPGSWVRKHLLSFFLVCAECGDLKRVGHTQARTGNRYKTYVCSGLKKNNRGTNCRSAISYDVVEDVVRTHIASRLIWPDDALVRATAADRAAFQANHDAREMALDRRRLMNDAEIDDLDKLPMLAAVKKTLDALAEDFERLTQRASLAQTMREFVPPAEAWLEEVPGEAPGAYDIVQVSKALKVALQESRDRFDELALSTQRQILQALVRVEVLPAQRGLQYRGNPDLTALRVVIQDLDPTTGEPLE